MTVSIFDSYFNLPYQQNNKTMKCYKSILYFTILAGLTIALQSCDDTEEGDVLSDAVLASVNSLTFEAQNAKGKMITVYADANWVAEVPDWVTISPLEGKGVVDVTVSVSENVRDGAIDNPRTATLVFFSHLALYKPNSCLIAEHR
jgi:hypothetical protein